MPSGGEVTPCLATDWRRRGALVGGRGRWRAAPWLLKCSPKGWKRCSLLHGNDALRCSLLSACMPNGIDLLSRWRRSQDQEERGEVFSMREEVAWVTSRGERKGNRKRMLSLSISKKGSLTRMENEERGFSSYLPKKCHHVSWWRRREICGSKTRGKGPKKMEKGKRDMRFKLPWSNHTFLLG